MGLLLKMCPYQIVSRSDCVCEHVSSTHAVCVRCAIVTFVVCNVAHFAQCMYAVCKVQALTGAQGRQSVQMYTGEGCSTSRMGAEEVRVRLGLTKLV